MSIQIPFLQICITALLNLIPPTKNFRFHFSSNIILYLWTDLRIGGIPNKPMAKTVKCRSNMTFEAEFMIFLIA